MSKKERRVDTKKQAKLIGQNWKPHYFIDVRMDDFKQPRIKVWSIPKDETKDDFSELLLDVPFHWLWKK